MAIKKLASELTIEDFLQYPVWKFTNADEENLDETVMSPVRRLPVIDLGNCVVGTQLILNNGETVWGTLCNIDLDNLESTRHFLTLSVMTEKREFHLARYFDVTFEREGPIQLAKFLKLSLNDVFPIRYDISGVAKGRRAVVKGMYPAEPTKRLTQEEMIQLAIRGRY